ncbi:UNVERIFIED_ORG: hypothetical protein J2W74_002012 [Methylorubrum zatmanii]
MTPLPIPQSYNTETYPNASGDLILPIIIDPAVASQIRFIADRLESSRLSEAVTDLLLVGLISVNSTARLS